MISRTKAAAVAAVSVAALVGCASPAAGSPKRTHTPAACAVSTTSTTESRPAGSGYQTRTVTTRTTDCPGSRHDSRTVSYGAWSAVHRTG